GRGGGRGGRGEEGGRQLTQAGPWARPAKRARQQLATLLGDGAQQLLKKGDVYRNGACSQFCEPADMVELASEYNNLTILRVPRRCVHLAACVTAAAFTAMLTIAHPSRRTPVTTETYEIVAIKY